MPFCGAFSTADPTTQRPYSIDFSNQLPSGDTVSSVMSVALAVVRGVDSTPNSRLIGVPSISGNVVSQVMASLQAGTTYALEITIASTNGRILVGWGTVECEAIP